MSLRWLLIPLVLLLPLLGMGDGAAYLAAQQGIGDVVNKQGMHFAYIKPGHFMMGVPRVEKRDDAKDKSEHEEAERLDELEHKVSINQGFYMGRYEVTQEEYQKVMGVNPSHFRGDKLPVERVSWYDAKEFCRKLSQLEGRTYTLPTEAEWEYACRAGKETTYHFGMAASADKANYDARKVFPLHLGKPGEFRDRTTPVGSFEPNPWKLYDMHGNVWEWCEDWYSIGYYRVSPEADPKGPVDGQSRVARGGSWFYEPSCCRAAYRTGFRPNLRTHNLGFRVVTRGPEGAL